MGKVKRQRQKVHNAAVKVKQDSAKEDRNTDVKDIKNLPPGMSHAEVRSSLFDGLDMSKYNITTKLPDFDARSTLSSKSLKGLNLKKKEKQKLRHDLWIQKLSALDAAKKKAKEKALKAKTPVVGDIGALGDALPTLDLLLKKSTGPKTHGNDPKKRKEPKLNIPGKKQMLADISIFQQVLKDPSYRKNPTVAISEHLHERQRERRWTHRQCSEHKDIPCVFN